MIRGEKRAVIQRKSAELSAEIHNRFDVEVVDASTGMVRQRARAYNVICDLVWSALLNNRAGNEVEWNKYLHYGSGTGTPSSSDTTLFHFEGALSWQTGEDRTAYDKDRLIYSMTRRAVLLENVAVGVSLSEVGIASYASGPNLCTHAMLQDMNGNQITIQKTETDIINIYATVFVHLPPEAGQFIYVDPTSWLFPFLAGTNWSFLSSSSWGLGGRCSFVGSDVKAGMSPKRDPNNRRITFSGRVPAASCNGFGGFTSVIMSTGMRFSLNSSWYSSTQITGETIGTGDGTTVDFTTAFGFVENLNVYVDGSPVQNFKADAMRPVYDAEWFPFLRLLTEDGVEIKNNRDSYLKEGYVLENQYYNEIGFRTIMGFSCTMYCSNDMKEWTKLLNFGRNGYAYPIPVEHQHDRYWKCTETGGLQYFAPISAANIHFSTPPAAGTVITADYTSRSIAKDENHVFDFSVTIQLGEYMGGG